jgi:hypothetical protein
LKKRLFLLLAAMLAIGSLVGGATFALLSSESRGHSNTFQAGTLHVAITNGNGLPLDGPFMSFDEMAPGDTRGPFQVWVKNTGSLPLVYNFDLVRTGGPDAADNALADALSLLVERENPDGSWTSVGEQTVTQWDTAGVSEWQPTLPAGAMAHFRYTANLPQGTGNAAQAGSVMLTLLISATQPSIIQGGAPVITGTWTGSYAGSEAPPGEPVRQWRFVATVVQTGNTFTGTMVELDDPGVGVTQISGTIDGTSVSGTRQYPVFLGGPEPVMWTINFTGEIQPSGKLVIGTADNNSRQWSATK